MSGILQLLASGGAGPTDFGGTLYRSNFGSTCSASLTVGSDGSFSVGGTGSIVSNTIGSDAWYYPNLAGVGSSYWVRATLSSGSTPSTGTMGSWQQLSSGRTWSNSSGGGAFGSRTSTILFEVSTSSGGTPVVCSGTVTITAEHES